MAAGAGAEAEAATGGRVIRWQEPSKTAGSLKFHNFPVRLEAIRMVDSVFSAHDGQLLVVELL